MHVCGAPPDRSSYQSLDRHANNEKDYKDHDTADGLSEHEAKHAEKQRQYNSKKNSLPFAVHVSSIIGITFHRVTAGADHGIVRENVRAKRALLLAILNFPLDG